MQNEKTNYEYPEIRSEFSKKEPFSSWWRYTTTYECAEKYLKYRDDLEYAVCGLYLAYTKESENAKPKELEKIDEKIEKLDTFVSKYMSLWSYTDVMAGIFEEERVRFGKRVNPIDKIKFKKAADAVRLTFEDECQEELKVAQEKHARQDTQLNSIIKDGRL
jgi:hypothetical protein